jgi:hypothetical protein
VEGKVMFVINAILIIVVFGVAIFFAIPLGFLRIIWSLSEECEQRAQDWLDASLKEMKVRLEKKSAK